MAGGTRVLSTGGQLRATSWIRDLYLMVARTQLAQQVRHQAWFRVRNCALAIRARSFALSFRFCLVPLRLCLT